MAEFSIFMAKSFTSLAESSTFNIEVRVVSFAPSKDGQSLECLKDVVLRINECASLHSYVKVLD